MSREEFFHAQPHTAKELYVANIFETVDGEANAYHTGAWSVFIRLQGCRIGCKWCDSHYTWDPRKHGQHLTPGEIIRRLSAEYQAKKVTITGGEPMEQWGYALSELITLLTSNHYAISMETGGCDDLAPLISAHPNVNLVVDYKMPSAAIVRPMCFKNFPALRHTDIVKMVCTKDEVRDIAAVVKELRTTYHCTARMVFSPLWAQHAELPAFIEAARRAGLPRLGVGLNLQTHKFIWAANPREEEKAAVV